MAVIESPFLTVPETAAFIRLSVSRLRELVYQGKIPAIRTGRRGEKVLFSRAAVEKWVLRRGRMAQKKEAAPEVREHRGARRPTVSERIGDAGAESQQVRAVPPRDRGREDRRGEAAAEGDVVTAELKKLVVYGARCTWWDSIGQAGRLSSVSHRLPCEAAFLEEAS